MQWSFESRGYANGLRYMISGSGEVLLLHGLGGTMNAYDMVVKLLHEQGI